MLRLDARLGEIWGFSPLVFVRGHFWEIGIAALLFRVKPRHMEKFRKCRFADVGKSELEKNKKETCAKHKIERSQNGRSNNHNSIALYGHDLRCAWGGQFDCMCLSNAKWKVSLAKI